MSCTTANTDKINAVVKYKYTNQRIEGKFEIAWSQAVKVHDKQRTDRE